MQLFDLADFGSCINMMEQKFLSLMEECKALLISCVKDVRRNALHVNPGALDVGPASTKHYLSPSGVVVLINPVISILQTQRGY